MGLTLLMEMEEDVLKLLGGVELDDCEVGPPNPLALVEIPGDVEVDDGFGPPVPVGRLLDDGELGGVPLGRLLDEEGFREEIFCDPSLFDWLLELVVNGKLDCTFSLTLVVTSELANTITPIPTAIHIPMTVIIFLLNHDSNDRQIIRIF